MQGAPGMQGSPGWGHDPGAPQAAGGAPLRGPDGWISPQTRQIGGFAARPLPDNGDGVRVFHLPRWKDGDDRGRVAALRQIALEAGRDPRMATIAVGVLRRAGAPPRAYEKQAEALLRYVQTAVYYVNEPGERLQDPFYTLQVGYGDCDDMAILLAALAESLRLPWRMAISGNKNGRMVRWVEGEPYPADVKWSHIYVRLGWPAFTPKTWVSAEPTLRGVPLGWDVVDEYRKHGKLVLPELAGVELAGVEPGAMLVPAVRPEQAEPFWQHVQGEIRAKLHPRALVPAVIVGLVIGAVAETTRRALSKAFKARGGEDGRSRD
jgi:hypothetical protein